MLISSWQERAFVCNYGLQNHCFPLASGPGGRGRLKGKASGAPRVNILIKPCNLWLLATTVSMIIMRGTCEPLLKSSYPLFCASCAIAGNLFNYACQLLDVSISAFLSIKLSSHLRHQTLFRRSLWVTCDPQEICQSSQLATHLRQPTTPDIFAAHLRQSVSHGGSWVIGIKKLTHYNSLETICDVELRLANSIKLTTSATSGFNMQINSERNLCILH